MIVLDSDVLIEILGHKSSKGTEAYRRIFETKEDVCTTVINLNEVLFGLLKYGKPVNELLQFNFLNFTKNDAMLSSELELWAQKTGKPIMRTDAMIAAIVINNNALLCTFNLRHFEPLKDQDLELFML